ncbi:MAG: ABC transporter permease [Vicinamibacterales bacterium]
MGSELRWAWRGVRARGWQAALVVVLLGVAIGANTIVFSAADAFVFRRAPYADADRLVVFQYSSSRGVSNAFSAPAILEWRRQKDLLVAMEAHSLAAPVYVTVGDLTESVRAERVSPGMFDMLGQAPAWGRPLLPSDTEPGARPVALVGEEIATRVFGGASLAVGKVLATRDGPLEIIGVMPASFRFPTAQERIWMPLAFDITVRNVGYTTIARLAPGISFEQAAAGISQRALAIDHATGLSFVKRYPLTLRTLNEVRGDPSHSMVIGMLGAAALCLLLIACANVASLELAFVSQRATALGVQAALGAGRMALVRARFLEAAILLTVSAAGGAALAVLGSDALIATLPPAMALQLANALDFDGRAAVFMLSLAAATWLMTAVLPAWRASRANLMDVLRQDTRGVFGSSAPLMRHVLVVTQVAVTVFLLIGAVLFARTYAGRLEMDKGFDSRSVVAIQVLPAPNAALRGEPLVDAVSAMLVSHPAVVSVARTDDLPPVTAGGISGKLKVNGAETGAEVFLSTYAVAPEYFQTLGVPMLEGAVFAPGDPPAKVVIDEMFAGRFWPGGSALGSRFSVGSAGVGGAYEFEIVGIAQHVRPDRTTAQGGRDLFVFYHAIRSSTGSASFVARLRSPGNLGEVASVVRAVAGRAVVRVDTIDERYARLEGDSRLAAVATVGFGAAALLIAAAGIYAVMAFMVSGRRREIGVRLALGATGADIRRIIFGTSLKFLMAGAIAGLAAAAAASEVIRSQLFGVSATDPLTYASAAGIVIAAGALATWYPARQAARVDPAVTLRSQ